MKRLLSLAVLLSLALAGCSSGNHDDLRQWMRDASKNLHGKIPPLPEVKPYEPAPYLAETLPDPFKPGRIESDGPKKRGGGRLQPDFEARELRNNPLERYALETINMIGYIKIGNVPYAVVVVDQLVKQVKIGDYIGQDFGMVTQIADTEVSIRELVQDAAGDWTERNSTLFLQDKLEKKENKR